MVIKKIADEGHIEISLKDHLIKYSNEKFDGDDVAMYRKASVSRSVWSDIMNNRGKAKRHIVLAFAVALELDIDETTELMESAGYSFPCGPYEEKIKYYILTSLGSPTYGVAEANEVLHILHGDDIGNKSGIYLGSGEGYNIRE